MERRAAGVLSLLVVGTVWVGGPALAQQSAGYRLQEHAFNAGGGPRGGVVLVSASFRISVDSLGEPVVAVGTSSASFRIDSGFVVAYPAPGEVSDLRFADAHTLVWAAEGSVGSYNLYRGLIGDLASLGYGECAQQGLAGETATDADAVPAGQGYFYLVTAENRIAQEGTKGFDSGAVERAGAACP